jgi:lipopolysaccharide biosynthesis glycosyltransferase
MDSDATKSQQEPLVLVFGADDNHAMALAVALYSALIHLERGCTLYLYVIDVGIGRLNKRRLRRIANFDHLEVYLEWVKPNFPPTTELRVTERLTAATYSRFLIADFVSERFDKAIYLDCDVMVESNLMNLWKEEISDHALLAVRSFVNPYVSSSGGVVNYEDLGLRPDNPYFNAGVLVLNLKRWRSERFAETLFDYVRQYKHFMNTCSQEPLNAVLADDWGMLDPKWNVVQQILFMERYEASDYGDKIKAERENLLNKAYIHHVTSTKPWELNCEHPGKVKWRRYLQESNWFGPIEDTAL